MQVLPVQQVFRTVQQPAANRSQGWPPQGRDGGGSQPHGDLSGRSSSWLKLSWNAGGVKPTIAYQFKTYVLGRDSQRCCFSSATFSTSCFFLTTTRISCQQICTVLWPKKSTMQATSRRWVSRLPRLGLYWMATLISCLFSEYLCVCVCVYHSW